LIGGNSRFREYSPAPRRSNIDGQLKEGTMWKLAASALLLAAMIQEKGATPVTIQLEGLMGACCEKPVQAALAKMDGVGSAKLESDGELVAAKIVLKGPRGLALSEIDRALEGPNKGMGAQMGTTYEVVGELGMQDVYLIKTKAKPDEAKLTDSLRMLDGFKSVKVIDGGFLPVFQGEKVSTLAQVKKAAVAEIVDVVLAPQIGGFRYWCPMHPDVVSATEVDCPKCGESGSAMKLVKIAASQNPPPAPAQKGEKKKGC